ncbi:MAG: sulfite exporter TauE/SafE family protein [Pseudomonadota bacterium]
MEALSQALFFVLALAAAGALAGLTAGLFGIGGGFVIVPVLLIVLPLFVPESPHLVYVAVGTSLASIVVSSLRSAQAHHAAGAVDFEVLRGWSPWLVLGVLGGLALAAVVNGVVLLYLFAVGVLLYSVYFLLPERFETLVLPGMPTGAARASLASLLGGFSALLGIGGGTVTVLTMVVCSRPVHQAVGTAAAVGFIIGLPGALGFLLLGLNAAQLPVGSVGYINLPALAAISIASIFTAPVGARLAHRLDERRLKRWFGIYLVVVSIGMFGKAAGA